MSKLTIIGVIVLMSISLLGVVGLQLYWISDAVRVKQEQFDRSVHEALARVVEKLETQEAVSAVASGMATLQHNPDEPIQDTAVSIYVASPGKNKPQEPAATSGTSGKPKQQPVKSAAAASSSKDAATKTEKPKTAATTISGQAKLFPGNSIQYVQVGQPFADSVFQSLTRGARVQGMPAIPPKQLQRLATAQGIAVDSLRARVMQMSGNSTFKIRHLSDSTVTYSRQIKGQPFRISVDTLQYIALHMDSLRHNKQLFTTLKPAEISSINVQRDSIIILKRTDGSKPLVNRQNGAGPEHGRTGLQDTRPRYEDRIPQESAGSTRFIVRHKQPDAQAKPATEKKSTPKQATDGVSPATPDPVKVEAKKEKLNNVVEKMVVEYVSKDVPLENRLDLANLKPMLQTELHDKGIALDFGYWVLSGQQDTVAASYISAKGSDNFYTYKANLFPNDIFDKPDHLAVYFPDSQAYALRSLWVMLLFSAVFTLVIMATFGTTIHIIFRQKKLSDMKNDFINNMTHEFKTPIATISLATDSIANPKIYGNPDKIQYYTNIIRQENKRMNVQVENVLQIAQLEKNDYRMNLQPVDLHSLICKAVESIRLQVEERLGQISAQLDALEHELKLDEVHAYNVICNLLDNANKYSPSSPDIRLVTQNVEGGILLAVEDKGMGMTRDTQLRVFDKFYRVPTGNLHNVKGFGLGLSYVKAIVKAHNGNIRLQSEPGKGSRFEIFLPFNA